MGKIIDVTAAMSGIFYRQPSPEEPPYAEVGMEVKKKQVLGLLETMKVFQKIKSPVKGKVVEIVAEDESPLKDGDTIFRVEKQ
ncbi:MAG: biotin/lipoyl-containing protein [Thermodesulfobacteriota bacterium]